MRLIDAEQFEDRYFIGKEEIENAPTIKAIPMGWISAYTRRAIKNADYWVIIRMVTAWEDEGNEI